MYKPYFRPVTAASVDHKLPEPHISRVVFFVIRMVGRIYLFFYLGVTRIVVRNGRPLYEAYKRALHGKSRCILAFRHPNGGEAQILMFFSLLLLRRKAWMEGVKLHKRPYVSFVYGYEVARWGGAIARWIMPGLGAMPVHHTKLDSTGMSRIINAVADGPYPLAIAPEGQVSYTTESVPRLEQGTVRIGFLAAEQLDKKGVNCPVEIIPLSIHFRYGNQGRRSMNRLLRKIEKYTGLKKEEKGFSERLRRSRDYILEQNEKRYDITPSPDQSFNERVDIIMDAALKKAERILGIHSKSSDIVNRGYEIRQISWDRMIIPGITSFDNITLLERAIMDLNAGEAWHASRHMELVDLAWYFRVPVPTENDPLYVRLEYVQNLWDFASRTMGGAYANRVMNVHPKRVLIQVGTIINLSERLPEYKENRRTAIAGAMKDLETAYLDCIDRAAEYQI